MTTATEIATARSTTNSSHAGIRRFFLLDLERHPRERADVEPGQDDSPPVVALVELGDLGVRGVPTWDVGHQPVREQEEQSVSGAHTCRERREPTNRASALRFVRSRACVGRS